MKPIKLHLILFCLVVWTVNIIDYTNLEPVIWKIGNNPHWAVRDDSGYSIHDKSSIAVTNSVLPESHGGLVPQTWGATHTDHIVSPDIEALIRKTFPEEPDTAIAVAKAESGLNPKAVNDKNRNGSKDFGLFQINSIHNPTEAQKFTPDENIKLARKIYEKNGWKAWSAYNNGAFRKHL